MKIKNLCTRQLFTFGALSSSVAIALAVALSLPAEAAEDNESALCVLSNNTMRAIQRDCEELGLDCSDLTVAVLASNKRDFGFPIDGGGQTQMLLCVADGTTATAAVEGADINTVDLYDAEAATALRFGNNGDKNSAQKMRWCISQDFAPPACWDIE